MMKIVLRYMMLFSVYYKIYFAVKLQWGCTLNVNNIDFKCTETNKTPSQLEIGLTNRLLEQFQINNKNFQFLPDYAFKNLSIKDLELINNEIEYFSTYSFVGLSTPETFDANFNKIKSLNSFIASIKFARIISIQRLNFENNLIERIDTGFGESFKSLRYVKLGQNKISYIVSNAFEKTPNLLDLDIKSNSLRNLDFGLVLKYNLNVDNNHINTFKKDLSENFTRKTLHLYCQESQISSIEPLAFSNFLVSKSLYLKLNKLTILKSSTFRNLFDLETLDLEKNLINTIEEGAFEDLNNLRDLNLAYNSLAILKRNFLSNISSLESLNLKYNEMDSIEDNSFLSLTNSRKLDLSYNRLTIIKTNTFNGLSRLDYLFLVSNPISKIEPYSFVNLKSCCKSWNDLMIIIPHEGLELNQLKLLNLDNFVFIGLDGLHSLELEYNKRIDSIKMNTFYGLFNLLKLKLGNNLISKIDDYSFSSLVRLDSLDLTNNFISKFNKEIFFNLTVLTYLDLSVNCITVLQSSLFVHLTNLRALYLMDNEMKDIRPNAFSNLGNMRTLNLGKNKLEKLKIYYFDQLNNLELLVLSKNLILFIDSNTFKSLRNLEELDLSFNSVEDLPANCLRNMTNLRILYLNANRIKVLSNDLFSGLDVFELNLSNNLLEELQEKLFFNLTLSVQNYKTNSKVLHFSNNKISIISHKFYYFSVSNFKGLTILNLTKNNISSLNFIRNNTFLRRLKILDLSDNKIEYLTQNDFKIFSSLEHIHLSNNRIKSFGRDTFSINSLEGLYINHQSFDSNFTFDMKDVAKNVEELDLSNNFLTNIKFSSLKKLKKLRINNIHVDPFSSVLKFDFPSLENLHLSDNKIDFTDQTRQKFTKFENILVFNVERINLRSLDSINWTNFKSMEDLYLSYNKLESIFKKEIGHLKRLKRIYINDNKISFIEKNTFSYMSYLTLINAENNNLINFNFEDFSSNYLSLGLHINFKNNSIGLLTKPEINLNLDLLTSLDLSFNSIQDLAIDRLITNKNLIGKISLNNNKLTKVSASLFRKLSQILSLSLEFNEISCIEPFAFYNSYLLEKINLSNNNLSTLNQGTFEGLFQAKYLDLSSNYLEHIQSHLFEDLFNLVYLNLNSNKLRLIENFSFKNLNVLRILILQFNFDVTLENQSFIGLTEIRKLYLSSRNLINNSVNSLNAITALKPQFYKEVLGRHYYFSVNLLYTESDIDCELTLKFIRCNLHLMLEKDKEVKDYLGLCKNYSLVEKLTEPKIECNRVLN